MLGARAGAGVAGLATARALRLAGVDDVTVVERRPGAPKPGLGLDLPGTAVRALGALGVAEQVHAAGVPVTRREFRTDRGRLLFAVDEAGLWSGVAPPVCVRPGPSRLAALPDGLTHLPAPFAGPRAYRAAYRPLRAAP